MSLFTSSRKAPKVTGLRNRLTGHGLRTGNMAKDNIGGVGQLRVMREDGAAESILEPRDERDEDEDVLLHSETSSSGSVELEERGVAGDPALNNAQAEAEDKVHGAHSKQERPPPQHRSSSWKLGESAEFQDGRGRRRRRSTSVPPGPVSSSASGWLGVDISLIIALASPIGSLLTGSDHFKNVILILLLIYYLHQLVEVPWSLYRMSIPRHQGLVTSEAFSELRTLEVFYLVLTVVTPFLGSSLLRHVAKAVTGKKDSLSWFSTSLFILATGIRPWTHLVERLKSRSEALNKILKDEHENAMNKGSEREGHSMDVEEEMGSLRNHLQALDERFGDLSHKTEDEVRDFSDHLDEIVDTVEIKFRRHRAELARGNQLQDSRIAALEAQVQVLTAAIRRGDAINADRRRRSMDALIFFHALFLLPVTILRWTWNLVRKPFVKEVEQPMYYRRRLSRSHSSPSLRSSLASIPEEEQSTQIGPDTDSEYYSVQSKQNPPPGVIMSLLTGLSKIFLSPILVVIRVTAFLLGIPKSIF